MLIFKGLFPESNLNEYVVGYKHNHNIKPLCIKLLKYICSGKTLKKIRPYLLKLPMLIFVKSTMKYGKRLRN